MAELGSRLVRDADGSADGDRGRERRSFGELPVSGHISLTMSQLPDEFTAMT